MADCKVPPGAAHVLTEMLLPAFSLVVCIGPSCLLAADESSPKIQTADDAKLIQGTWVMVDLQQAGRQLTKDEKELFKRGGYKITITGEKMVHSPDKSEVRYRLDTTKTPPVLELLDGGNVIAKAIHKLRGDDLTICQGRKPDGGREPEPPADFDIKKAAPGTG